MEHLRGLELLYLLNRDQITCKEDCLVLVFHSVMINDGKKCVGVGDEFTECAPGRGSEALPTGWNANREVYSLRYTSDSSPGQYLLKVVKTAQFLLVNLLDINEEKASSVVVNIDSHVLEDFANFSSIYVDLEQLSKKFRREVLGRVRSQQSGISECHQHATLIRRDVTQQQALPVPTMGNEESCRRESPPVRGGDDEDNNVFPSVGHGDLDPFAGGSGGGMLADPRSFGLPGITGPPNLGSHGIPRASVPPGARYDPVGPPGAGRGFTQPDPDHHQPPGFDDNPL